MSTRTLITTIAVAAAFLTFPVLASARLADAGPVAVHAKAQPAIAVQASAPAVSTHSTNGTGTATVVLIAGLTLLAGAVTGVEGARLMRRRRGAVQA
jgi:hypothetical protein